jgi:hypothetical protein
MIYQRPSLEEFKRERNAALLSLDENRIRAYASKYGIVIPNDPDLFWASVHKAITADMELPLVNRQASKDWLTARKLHSLDDGDLA